jgi:hypothetical protein
VSAVQWTYGPVDVDLFNIRGDQIVSLQTWHVDEEEEKTDGD